MSNLQLISQQASSPSIFSGAAQFSRHLASHPFDLALGVMWTSYVVVSVKELAQYFFSKNQDRNVNFSFVDREVSRHDLVNCIAFATANIFKFIDWFGQSPLRGATKVAFPMLSAAADVLYVFSYGMWAIRSAKDLVKINRRSELKTLDYQSQMNHRGSVLKHLADYGVNLSYLCFSVLSLVTIATGAAYLGTAMAVSLVSYFTFLGLRSFGDEAASVFKRAVSRFSSQSHHQPSNLHRFV